MPRGAGLPSAGLLDADDVPAEYRGIGIRVEHDVAIDAQGRVECFTLAAPPAADDRWLLKEVVLLAGRPFLVSATVSSFLRVSGVERSEDPGGTGRSVRAEVI